MRERGMPTDPIQRATAVARDYDGLQGLISLGSGIGLIIMALADDPLFGAIVVAAAVPIGQGYYYKRYGKVRQNAAQQWAGVGAAVLVVVVACIGIIADVFLRAPVMLGPLAGAAALLIFSRQSYRRVGMTHIHSTMVGVLALSSLLPFTGLVSADGYWRADVGLLGLALVVVGAVDHYRLTQAMKPVTDG